LESARTARRKPRISFLKALVRNISYRLFEGTIVKLTVDKTDDCGNVEITIDRATAKDIRQARAADPENTRKLLALVRTDSEPAYRRNRCGFAAILKGKR